MSKQEKWKMQIIDEDMIVACDRDGNDIPADRLQRWAYNQLEIAPEMKDELTWFVGRCVEVSEGKVPRSLVLAEASIRFQAILRRIGGE